MPDITCPYCEFEQEVCHDDGYGYEEDVLHEMECYECEKNFTFTTAIRYSYNARKAPCLNGSDHKCKPTITYPKQYTRMQCGYCDHERKPTPSEWDVINKPHST